MLDEHEGDSFGSVILWYWVWINTRRRPYLTCCIRVQDLVFNDEPKSLPLLLFAVWPLQIPTHGRVCACWHLKQRKIRWVRCEVITTASQCNLIMRKHLSPDLFKRCRYLLLLPGESKGSSAAGGYSCWQGLLTWCTGMWDMHLFHAVKIHRIPSVTVTYPHWCFSLRQHKNMRKTVQTVPWKAYNVGNLTYFAVAEECGNTDHIHVPSHSSGIQGSVRWRNKTCTPPDGPINHVICLTIEIVFYLPCCPTFNHQSALFSCTGHLILQP